MQTSVLTNHGGKQVFDEVRQGQNVTVFREFQIDIVDRERLVGDDRCIDRDTLEDAICGACGYLVDLGRHEVTGHGRFHVVFNHDQGLGCNSGRRFNIFADLRPAVIELASEVIAVVVCSVTDNGWVSGKHSHGLLLNICCVDSVAYAGKRREIAEESFQ